MTCTCKQLAVKIKAARAVRLTPLTAPNHTRYEGTNMAVDHSIPAQFVSVSCRHCGSQFQKPLISPPTNTKFCSLACRYWSKVDTSGGPDACWPWIAKARAQDGEGYGHFAKSPRQHTNAHRVAWELTNGPIPDGLHGCHKCDNVLCCNPSHLFLGTPKENSADMWAKGRHHVSPEGRERTRQAKLGKPRPPEVREKLRLANLGKPTGRRGIPNGQAGKPKPKQSEAMRAYWVRRKSAEEVQAK